MKHANQCLWLLGAGKTSIANALMADFRANNKKCILLDGDVLRTGLNNNLGRKCTPHRRSSQAVFGGRLLRNRSTHYPLRKYASQQPRHFGWEIH